MEYIPSGPAAMYCSECARKRRLASAKKRTMEYRIKNGLIQKPYSGKGGNNAKGMEDSQYVSGISYFQNNRRVLKLRLGNVCNRCSADLTNANRYEWAIHHIDHDRKNNSDDNFELLCKKCHQLEHDCIAALQSEKV